MYFTVPQIKAMLFVLICLLLAGVYHYAEKLLHPVEPVDFSKFEATFQARYDSIQTLLTTDSIPRAASFEASTSPALQTTSEGHPRIININTATIDQLTTLPRIGPKMAARIVEYRQQYGGFSAKKELLNIKGIGPKTYAKLQHLITVD